MDGKRLLDFSFLNYKKRGCVQKLTRVDHKRRGDIGFRLEAQKIRDARFTNSKQFRAYEIDVGVSTRVHNYRALPCSFVTMLMTSGIVMERLA